MIFNASERGDSADSKTILKSQKMSQIAATAQVFLFAQIQV